MRCSNISRSQCNLRTVCNLVELISGGGLRTKTCDAVHHRPKKDQVSLVYPERLRRAYVSVDPFSILFDILPSKRKTMADLARSHAVVIGAGMAGLTAAQAISRHFGKVTIIERDVLPAEAAPRSGTPQAQHAHMLLAGGLKALQTLFPGFENDLAEAGAVKIRTGKDLRF
jgi:threonine dehydrogenase-like Zn-dependent dehydrogenase